MARIRSIKPEFWTDEKIVELDVWTRLLFIGLWNFADDEGRMVASERRIRMQIFPADTVDIRRALDELSTNGFIERYTVDGIEYLQIAHFTKHQKIDRRTPSKLPSPDGTLDEGSTNPPDGREGKGREKDQKEPRREKAAVKTTIPADFGITPSTRAWAREHGFEPYLEAHLEYFRDYAASGGKKYIDWDLAFRNCIRANWGNVRKGVPPGILKTLDQFKGVL